MEACDNGSKSLVELLLCRGANVSRTDYILVSVDSEWVSVDSE